MKSKKCPTCGMAMSKPEMDKMYEEDKPISSVQDLKKTFDKKFGRGALKKPKKEGVVY